MCSSTRSLPLIKIYQLGNSDRYSGNKFGYKFCKIVSLCRSPNQYQDEFEIFTNNLELILDKIFETNPFLVIALEDFNAKLSQWYKNDKTTTEGSKIANFTSQ